MSLLLLLKQDLFIVHPSDHLGNKMTPETWCREHPPSCSQDLPGRGSGESPCSTLIKTNHSLSHFYSSSQVIKSSQVIFLQFHLLIVKLSFKSLREFAQDWTASKWQSHWLEHQCHSANPSHPQKHPHRPWSKSQVFIDRVDSSRGTVGYLKKLLLEAVSPWNFKFCQRGDLF